MSNTSVVKLADPPRNTEVAELRCNMWSMFTLHIRRIMLEVVNLFFNHDWMFRAIGMLNRRITLIESVFLVYPATPKYAEAYVYPHRLAKVQWRPWPCGLLWQNGKLGIMFCISASHEQFADSQNDSHLAKVTERMEHIRLLLGAKRKSFAGILPGILYAKRIIREAPEAELTAEMVVQAIRRVQTRLAADTPVVVIGGRGFIGRRVVKRLAKHSAHCHCIDNRDGKGPSDWPYDQCVLAVNITNTNGSVPQYVKAMKPGTVLVNEAYPEPSQEVLKQMSAKRCVCYHVVGVRARALPSFPEAYRGAIPCCAAWPSPKMEVVVRRLN